MLDQVKEAIIKYNLIESGDKIVVAVSGGADSVALLYVLYMLTDEYNLTLTVCHLNHMLRGEDSDGDAKYVEELCDKLKIKSYIYSEDIEEYSRNNKLSFEEGAREARYRLFNEVLELTNSNKIAVAQNMNDQAETIIMRLARGAGLEGLTAIKHKRDNIIRPILSVSRDDIEKYCSDNNLLFRTDHTNFETLYTRNKIRLELIPYLKDNLNENIIKQLSTTTELLQTDLDYITSEVDKRYNNLVIDNCGVMEVNLASLNECHLAIRSRILRKLIGDLKGISQIHVDELVELCNNSVHGTYKIIKKYIKFEISYDKLLIYDTRDKNNLFIETEYIIGSKLLINNKELYSSKKISSDRNDLFAITIDCDKIRGGLKVRTRKTGDRFTPIGMSGSKKIKDIFINLKIPSINRDEILLLCDDENIIWIIGYRLSDLYKVDDNTKNKLTFTYK